MSQPARPLTPYQDVNDVLVALLTALRAALDDQLVGVYVGGSLAIGDFNLCASDIDLVVVTQSDTTDDLAASLRAAHDQITALPSPWARKLEVRYVPLDTLTTRRNSTQRCAYLAVGGRFTSGAYSADWIVQLHLIREHAIILAGPDPKALFAPITSDELRSSMRAVLDDWEPLLNNPTHFDAAYQAYTVLTMLRILYTLAHGAIASKRTAAEWAKATLEASWTPLIERALRWNPGDARDDLHQVLTLVRFTIERSRT